MIIESTEFCTIITADTGNVFRSKISSDILTDRLYLGCNDSVDNYEEISKAEAYTEAEEEKEISENGVF